MKVCSVPRCPNLASGSRCDQHRLPARGRPHRRNSQHALTTATVCAVCGNPPTPADPLTRGHVVALADGGTNHPGNYRAEHASCNKRGGALITNGAA